MLQCAQAYQEAAQSSSAAVQEAFGEVSCLFQTTMQSIDIQAQRSKDMLASLTFKHG